MKSSTHCIYNTAVSGVGMTSDRLIKIQKQKKTDFCCAFRSKLIAIESELTCIDSTTILDSQIQEF